MTWLYVRKLTKSSFPSIELFSLRLPRIILFGTKQDSNSFSCIVVLEANLDSLYNRAETFAFGIHYTIIKYSSSMRESLVMCRSMS